MANKEDPLGSYRGKRDFERRPEPLGGRKRRSRTPPRFVVHKHDATTLRYDFRLEAAGVLKSWACQRGHPPTQRTSGLAMPTEDHPLDYVDYEGLIREGQHGAGPVIVWDTGSYRSLTEEDDGKTVPSSRRSRTDMSPCAWGGASSAAVTPSPASARVSANAGCWSRWPTSGPTPGASQSRANRTQWSRVEPSRRSPRRPRRDLAYTVGYEHTAFSMDGGPVAPITLRVTHVYRREDGEWKIVHRHADVPPTGQLHRADASTE